ncbi:MAG: hypothetical protein WEB60_00130, partial [Terrimicrobiaceae bacterium]
CRLLGALMKKFLPVGGGLPDFIGGVRGGARFLLGGGGVLEVRYRLQKKTSLTKLSGVFPCTDRNPEYSQLDA